MKRTRDLIGQRFGRLLVVDETKPLREHCGRYWECVCDCGKHIVKREKNLIQGNTRSCGCLFIETHQTHRTHGMSKTNIYRRWLGMKARCKRDSHYKDVNICPEWDDFLTFHSWAMNNGYSKDLTLDRIDPYGDYEPSNCRWVDMKTQSNNRRNNSYYTVDGVTHTLSEWVELYNYDIKTVLHRLQSGMSMKEALMKPINNSPKRVVWVETGQEYKSIRECSRDTGIDHTLISDCAKGKRENTHGYHFRFKGEIT